MENPSSPRLGKLSSSGLPKVRTTKHVQHQDPGSLPCQGNNKNSAESDDTAEGRRKGRPKNEGQELRSIPATVSEKMSVGCPYCEATFNTKVRLEKHKLWNHPERVSLEAKEEQHKLQKKAMKSNGKKRPSEHSPPSPVFFKVKKIHETFTPFHNGELTHHKSERKLHNQPSPHVHQSAQSQSQQSHSASSDAGGSESEGGSPPPVYSDEDPERMRHRRKQKTPKKFTGEQPSISGTFGLKGMTKVEEKLKAGRLKKAEGSNFNEASQRRPAQNQPSKKDYASTSSSGNVTDTLWQKAISERGEVVCPTCSIVTRKTIQGLKNHMEICQKLQDALKCQQCQKQFRSKAGLNYHIMAEHSTKPSGSESQVVDEHDERERLRRTLKQMGRIKCPSEHSGKNHHSKAVRDYNAHTEHSATISGNVTVNNKVTDTNNNTGKDKVPEVAPSAGKKEVVQHERREWHDQPRQHKAREPRREDPEKDNNEPVKERPVQNSGLQEDFERTPSGRVRRRSAQVAVFHLQEIAEDELAKDWGTKRRNKDDLVPDSKRLNYTRPGLPNFSPELIESWKNQVKEKGFICCTNENCEAVYSSVSGLKAHLANCSQRGGELGKYTCLICQKAFNSESGVKYHISKTHSQNWFRAAASEVVSSSKPKSPEDNGFEPEVRNGKKRGRKPKERRPVAEPPHALAEESASSQNSSPTMSRSSSPTHMQELTDEENSGLSNPMLDRRNKPKKLLLAE